MIWLSYVLLIIFVGWLIYLCVFDVKSRSIPVWGLIVVVAISALNVCNRVAIIAMGDGCSGAPKIDFHRVTGGNLVEIGLGILPGIFLILLAFATKKIGLADGIVLCCMGLFDRYLTSVITFCIASFLIAIVSVVLLFAKKVKRNTQLPFIPFLVGGYIFQRVMFFL